VLYKQGSTDLQGPASAEDRAARGECGHQRHASSGRQRLPHINSGLWHVVCSLFSQFIAATSKE
jgi:hypothetical protein